MKAIRSHRRLAGLLLALLIGVAFGLIADLLALTGGRLAVGWGLIIAGSVFAITPWALARQPDSHPAIDLGPEPAFQLRMLWSAESLILASQSEIAESHSQRSHSSAEVRLEPSPTELTRRWS